MQNRHIASLRISCGDEILLDDAEYTSLATFVVLNTDPYLTMTDSLVPKQT